jgi:hypothetical protein
MLRTGVVTIVLVIQGFIQPKVGGQIDDTNPCGQQRSSKDCALPMGEGKECPLGSPGDRIDINRFNLCGQITAKKMGPMV